MEFKRYDGFINSSVQKKFDSELPICPFCGESPHWNLNVNNGFAVSATCMCEKCNGKLNAEYTVLNIDNLRVVDVGNKNIHNLSLNGNYHILSLKSLASDTACKNNVHVPTPIQNNIVATTTTANDNKKPIVTISVILSIIIFIGLLIWLVIPSSGTGNSLEPVQKSSMTVEEIYGTYYVTITGSAKNTSKRTMSYVSITFTLYDSAGNVVGTAIANQAGLSGGETWKYSATGISTTSKPASCKSTDVTYFFD